MPQSRTAILEKAANARRESKHVEFKSEFDVSSNGNWCEVIKDIIALANSGGGVIVFGVDNDGGLSGSDVSSIGTIDHADISNKIAKYTGYDFSEVEVVEVQRDSVNLFGFLVGSTDVPIVFAKPGTYEVGDSGSQKQKTAFGVGTIYFRHGAKSAPGVRDDLLKWRDDALERIKESWLGGIKKVVNAPAGHVFAVIPTGAQATTPVARITSNPNAPVVFPQNVEEVWPYRQKELLQLVNSRLSTGTRINGHDLYCVNKQIDVMRLKREFAYKPHRNASPQYSSEYANWLVEQQAQDNEFFAKAREAHKQSVRS